MRIKHQEIFQVYLPKNIGKDGDLSSMLMEEAHLISNGEMTPTFTPNDDDRNLLDVILYPSFIYAAKVRYKTEIEQIKEINERIDVEFCRMLIAIKPIYKITDFVDYHFLKCKKDKTIFLKHIKYVILPLIEKIIKNNSTDNLKTEYPEYHQVKEILNEWIEEKVDLLKPSPKMETGNNYKTEIEKAKNIVINNGKIKHQKNNFRIENNKKTLQIIGIVVSVLMLIIALIVNWNKIF